MSSPSLGAALAFVGLVGASSCGGSSTSPDTPPLQPPAAFGPDFLLRQQLVIEGGEHRAEIQAVLQRQGETLTLVGLTPFGSRAFVIEQRGLEVTSSSSLPQGMEQPLPPRMVLLDVQRTLLPTLAGGPPMTDGAHRGRVGGEAVLDSWEGGRLRERRIGPSPGHAGDIVIIYDGGMLPGEAPPRVVLENEGHGYRLVITTLSFQRL